MRAPESVEDFVRVGGPLVDDERDAEDDHVPELCDADVGDETDGCHDEVPEDHHGVLDQRAHGLVLGEVAQQLVAALVRVQLEGAEEGQTVVYGKLRPVRLGLEQT